MSSHESRWERSDKIAALAAFAAVFSMAISGLALFVAYVGHQKQFGEEISLELLESDGHYVFPHGIRRDKGSVPYVTKIGSWYRFRIANNSNKPVSITSFRYREDEGPWVEHQTPFLSGLKITENEIAFEKAMSLPLRLRTSEVSEVFIYIPTSVSQSLGNHLFSLFRNDGDDLDTQIELILFHKNYFEIVEQQTLKRLRSSKISEFLNFHLPEAHGFSAVRNPFLPDASGSIRMRDKTNDSKDGFRYRDANRLYNEAMELILGTPTETIKTQESIFEELEIEIKTAGGSSEYLFIQSAKMALNKLGTQN